MARGDNLPLAALQQIEAAALQLLSAVRQAGNGSFSSNTIPLRPARLPTVADLCNAFLLAKARAGRSARYLRLLRTEIYSFAKGRERRAAESVSSAEIESWLHSQHWAARTQRGRLMTVRNLFAWCVTRSELAANPALGVDMPFDDSDTAPPGIHTPDEARAVLIAARDTDLNAMRCLAVRYFAGLRTTEACALEEKEIHEEFIEVTAAKSKTRRRRLVTIQPNLRAWLALGGVLPLRQQQPSPRRRDGSGAAMAAQRHAAFVCELPPGEVSERGKDGIGSGAHRADAFRALPGVGYKPGRK